MSVYSISLFLHVVGALGLFAVLGLEWAGIYQLRRATEAGQVGEWLRLLSLAARLVGVAAVLTLITGIYMTATRWGPQGWILVGLAGMVVIAVPGGAVSGRRTGGIARALAEENGPISTALRGRLHDPALALSLRVRTALFIGIVFLMTTEPSTAISIAAMGVALVAGLAPAIPARAARRPGRMVGAAR